MLANFRETRHFQQSFLEGKPCQALGRRYLLKAVQVGHFCQCTFAHGDCYMSGMPDNYPPFHIVMSISPMVTSTMPSLQSLRREWNAISMTYCNYFLEEIKTTKTVDMDRI